MDKASITVAAAVLGFSAIASPTSAQSFAPINSFTELSGSLIIDQGLPVECDAQAGYSIDALGGANPAYSDISHPTDIRCGTFIREGGLWALSAFPGDGVSVRLRFNLITVAGWCAGYAWAPYDSSSGEVTFAGALVDGAPQDCVIDGVLTMNPKLIIVP